MKMNKKNVAVTIALTAGLTYTSVLPNVTYANTSANTSLDQINRQRSAQQSISAQLSAQQRALQADLQSMNKKQLQLTGEISKGQTEYNQTNDTIQALKSEISVIKKRIAERKALLNERLVSIYKNGGSVNFLEVLLGSKNFGDFLDRTKALYTITSQDQKIITQQNNDQLAVSQKKKSVESKQASNVARLEKLKKDLADVETLQKQRKIAVDALAGKQKNVSLRLTALAGAAANIAQAAQNVSLPSYSPSSSVSNSGSSSSQSGSSDTSSAPAAPSFNISASAATGGISGILNYGNRFIGRSSYVFGAANPSTGQFDCSGFVHAAFAANGIGVGRTTDALVSTGTPVSYSQAKPGDLIFFDTYKTNGHVGIYLGGGRFIGSQDSTGVAVVSMSNPYWQSHFSGVVRRVLN